MQKSFETGPRPSNPIIGYLELSAVLRRPAGSLRTSVHTLPLRRWRVARAVVWDADEVAAYVAARNKN